MKIERHLSFKRSYQKRIAQNPKLSAQTILRIKLFSENPTNPALKDHSLKGRKLGLRAFSVSGDIRIVYIKISENHVLFLDIGSHNQVY